MDDEKPYIRRRAYSKIHVTSWLIYLEKDGFVRCSFQNCNFMAFDVEEMCDHFGYCQGDSNHNAKFVCPHCEGCTVSMQKLQIHLAKAHQADLPDNYSIQLGIEKTDQRKPSKVLQVAWTSFMERHNYIKCPTCNFLANSIGEMCRHYTNCKMEMGALLYVCPECKGRTANINSLLWHLQIAHKMCKTASQFNHLTRSMIRFWETEIKNTKFASCLHMSKEEIDCFYFDSDIFGIIEHSQSCKGPLTYKSQHKCPKCPKWSNGDSKIKNHLKLVHSQETNPFIESKELQFVHSENPCEIRSVDSAVGTCLSFPSRLLKTQNICKSQILNTESVCVSSTFLRPKNNFKVQSDHRENCNAVSSTINTVGKKTKMLSPSYKNTKSSQILKNPTDLNKSSTPLFKPGCLSQLQASNSTELMKNSCVFRHTSYEDETKDIRKSTQKSLFSSEEDLSQDCANVIMESSEISLCKNNSVSNVKSIKSYTSRKKTTDNQKNQKSENMNAIKVPNTHCIVVVKSKVDTITSQVCGMHLNSSGENEVTKKSIGFDPLSKDNGLHYKDSLTLSASKKQTPNWSVSLFKDEPSSDEESQCCFEIEEDNSKCDEETLMYKDPEKPFTFLKSYSKTRRTKFNEYPSENCLHSSDPLQSNETESNKIATNSNDLKNTEKMSEFQTRKQNQMRDLIVNSIQKQLSIENSHNKNKESAEECSKNSEKNDKLMSLVSNTLEKAKPSKLSEDNTACDLNLFTLSNEITCLPQERTLPCSNEKKGNQFHFNESEPINDGRTYLLPDTELKKDFHNTHSLLKQKLDQANLIKTVDYQGSEHVNFKVTEANSNGQSILARREASPLVSASKTHISNTKKINIIKLKGVLGKKISSFDCDTNKLLERTKNEDHIKPTTKSQTVHFLYNGNLIKNNIISNKAINKHMTNLTLIKENPGEIEENGSSLMPQNNQSNLQKLVDALKDKPQEYQRKEKMFHNSLKQVYANEECGNNMRLLTDERSLENSNQIEKAIQINVNSRYENKSEKNTQKPKTSEYSTFFKTTLVGSELDSKEICPTESNCDMSKVTCNRVQSENLTHENAFLNNFDMHKHLNENKANSFTSKSSEQSGSLCSEIQCLAQVKADSNINCTKNSSLVVVKENFGQTVVENMGDPVLGRFNTAKSKTNDLIEEVKQDNVTNNITKKSPMKSELQTQTTTQTQCCQNNQSDEPLPSTSSDSSLKSPENMITLLNDSHAISEVNPILKKRLDTQNPNKYGEVLLLDSGVTEKIVIEESVDTVTNSLNDVDRDCRKINEYVCDNKNINSFPSKTNYQNLENGIEQKEIVEVGLHISQEKEIHEKTIVNIKKGVNFGPNQQIECSSSQYLNEEQESLSSVYKEARLDLKEIESSAKIHLSSEISISNTVKNHKQSLKKSFTKTNVLKNITKTLPMDGFQKNFNNEKTDPPTHKENTNSIISIKRVSDKLVSKCVKGHKEKSNSVFKNMKRGSPSKNTSSLLSCSQIAKSLKAFKRDNTKQVISQLNPSESFSVSNTPNSIVHSNNEMPNLTLKLSPTQFDHAHQETSTPLADQICSTCYEDQSEDVDVVEHDTSKTVINKNDIFKNESRSTIEHDPFCEVEDCNSCITSSGQNCVKKQNINTEGKHKKKIKKLKELKTQPVTTGEFKTFEIVDIESSLDISDISSCSIYNEHEPYVSSGDEADPSVEVIIHEQSDFKHISNKIELEPTKIMMNETENRTPNSQIEIAFYENQIRFQEIISDNCKRNTSAITTELLSMDQKSDSKEIPLLTGKKRGRPSKVTTLVKNSSIQPEDNSMILEDEKEIKKLKAKTNFKLSKKTNKRYSYEGKYSCKDPISTTANDENSATTELQQMVKTQNYIQISQTSCYNIPKKRGRQCKVGSDFINAELIKSTSRTNSSETHLPADSKIGSPEKSGTLSRHKNSIKSCSPDHDTLSLAERLAQIEENIHIPSKSRKRSLINLKYDVGLVSPPLSKSKSSKPKKVQANISKLLNTATDHDMCNGNKLLESDCMQTNRKLDKKENFLSKGFLKEDSKRKSSLKENSNCKKKQVQLKINDHKPESKNELLTEKKTKNVKKGPGDVVYFDSRPSTSQVECGVCNEEMTYESYKRHAIFKHYMLCWLKGEKTLDMDDDKEIVNRLWYVKKKLKNVPFRCFKCNMPKLSAVGFQSHIRFCGKENEEKESLLAACKICGIKMMPSSIRSHMNAKHQNDGIKINALGNASIDTSFIIPRSRRTAASKAEEVIIRSRKGDFEDVECSRPPTPDKKSLSHLYRMPSRNVNATVYAQWKKSLQETDIVCCTNPGCDFSAETTATFRKHYLACSFRSYGMYMCKHCDFSSLTEEIIEDHVDKSHDDIDPLSELEFSEDSDEDEDGASSKIKYYSVYSSPFNFLKNKGYLRKDKRYKLKYYMTTIMWTLALRSKTLSKEVLYDELQPSMHSWQPMCESVAKQYLPSSQDSVRFRSNNAEWHSLERFQGTLLDGVPCAFTGGPVWALAWAPVPDSQSYQFLAVATHPLMDSTHEMASIYSFKSLIQIWSFGQLNNKESTCRDTPQFLAGIGHSHGAVWGLQWCPSGCHQDGRIGLLAAACSDGHIVIYSVPKLLPSLTKPICEVQPVMELSLGSEMLSQCTSLDWHSVAPHNVIAGGFANGIVGLWDLNTKSPLLKLSSVILPYTVIEAHTSCVTAVSLSPTEEGVRLMTASLDKDTKFWSLDDTAAPINTLRKSNVLSAVMPANWLTSFSCYDDFYNLNATFISSYNYREMYHTAPNTNPLLQTGTVWSISFNNWLNAGACGSEVGKLTAFLCNQLLLHEDPKKAKYHTLVGDLMNCSVEPLVSRNTFRNSCLYQDVVDSVGLHFTFRDKVPEKEETTKSCCSCDVMDTYPLSSVNRVSWNCNFQSFTWVAAGLQCGLVVAPRIRCMDNNDFTRIYNSR